jgi:hypothetical protein
MKKQTQSITMLIVVKRIQVALRLNRKNAAQIVDDAKSYEDGISKNPGTFPNPSPSLATINTLVANLEGTFVKASSRVKGAVAEKVAAKKALELGLKSLANYVESVANANPDQAVVIVKLANMGLRSHKKATSTDFSMVQGPNTGELVLRAKGKKGSATYNFELSTDTSVATNWKSVQNNTRALAKITGLIIGTRYFGRVFRSDKSGTIQLGGVLSLVVN